MPTLEFKRTLTLPKHQVFALLEDASVYPQIFTRIQSVSDVVEQSGAGGKSTDMTVTLSFRVISGNVRVNVFTNPDTGAANFKLVKGPFNLARGEMTVIETHQGSEIVGACHYDTSFPGFSDLIQKKFETLLSTLCASLEQYNRKLSA